jgi:hypothetical protein
MNIARKEVHLACDMSSRERGILMERVLVLMRIGKLSDTMDRHDEHQGPCTLQ